MNVQLQFEPNIFMILPGIAVLFAECDCCEEKSWCIQIGWISWILIIDPFGGGHWE